MGGGVWEDNGSLVVYQKSDIGWDRGYTYCSTEKEQKGCEGGGGEFGQKSSKVMGSQRPK